MECRIAKIKVCKTVGNAYHGPIPGDQLKSLEF